jgi:hypothetical protein
VGIITVVKSTGPHASKDERGFADLERPGLDMDPAGALVS